MLHKEIDRKTVYRLLATLVFGWYSYGVAGDLKERYAPVISAGTRLPESLLVISFFIAILAVATLFFIWRPQVFKPFHMLRDLMGLFRWAAALVVMLIPCWILLFTRWNEVFAGTYLRSLLYLGATVLAAWLVTSAKGHLISWNGILQAGVLVGTIFMLARAAQDILPYPFGLGWSEGNRWWDYSVLFGRHLYNFPPDKEIPAYIDIGRQTLWGIIFLIPNLPIWAARLWDAFLFTIPYALLGWVIIPWEKKWKGITFFSGLWVMLFLNQGPIYTPLVICAIMVALARRAPDWLACLLVFAASFFATETRFTWTFAPAIWAIVTALAETRPGQAYNERRQWKRAILLGLSGLFGGFFLSQILQALSNQASGGMAGGNSLTTSGISAMLTRQPLLWDRLWPNTTYASGIVLGTLMAAGPLVVLLAMFSIRGQWKLNFWQAAAILGSLLAFLLVGLIVSVKIGGGSNLHNLDMFLIGLLFTAGLAWETGWKEWLFSANKQSWWKRLFLAAVVFIPASNGLLSAEPRGLPNSERVEAALESIRTTVADRKGLGEILFIDQRQLLTFGYISDIPLVPEYEKKRMMDMAMADDSAYFEPFNIDLYNHRFSTIISEPLWIQIQGTERTFNDENNSFVQWVSIPVLCYYEPLETYEDVGIQILVPRSIPLDDPNVKCPTP